MSQSKPLSQAVNNIKTVATQAYQIWLNRDLEEMGWPLKTTDKEQAILSGFTEPFDTWASMDQLLDKENWDDTPPKMSVTFARHSQSSTTQHAVIFYSLNSKMKKLKLRQFINLILKSTSSGAMSVIPFHGNGYTIKKNKAKPDSIANTGVLISILQSVMYSQSKAAVNTESIRMEQE